jgi:6-phosphogluconolactonase
MKITQRLAMLLLVAAATLAQQCLAQGSKKNETKNEYLAFVGTYTAKTKSKGIYTLRFDAESGTISALTLAAESADPSFLAVHPNGKHLYAVNETGKTSMVSAFSLDAQSGKLTLLNQLPSLGEDPCYISFDKTGKYVFVANYTSGNIAVFPIKKDGRLGEHTTSVYDVGPFGPNKERQEGPHAHWIEPSARNRFVYVADLGLDRVLIYKFEATKGTVTPGEPASSASQSAAAQTTGTFSVALNPGTGPRHVTFSRDGNFMYVLGELQSTVTVFANDGQEAYREVQRISALPANFSGRNDAAEIALHPSGAYLYTSNRGDDSIAVFAIDPHKGTLTLVSDVPTGGKEPRHFAIDPTGNYLLAENQLSDNIVVFKIDPTSGGLIPTGQVIEVPSPVDIAFMPTR